MLSFFWLPRSGLQQHFALPSWAWAWKYVIVIIDQCRHLVNWSNTSKCRFGERMLSCLTYYNNWLLLCRNMLQHCAICYWYSVTGSYGNTLWQGSVFVSPTTWHTMPQHTTLARSCARLTFLPLYLLVRQDSCSVCVCLQHCREC